ncbi:murein DD-endopeptidase MepM/ murein hydrolase activator NlpD [Rhodoglobus vestalii]|uniref:Murein DD-endopeptidase MepM/ murein hydrolase activator NlpD n=1 Tax=Rhodoglobus vestalii TaxID=193384 RepID=A0A8H2PY24_9MICO|nr:murein DD-endopeptidase MepM/ murein hydrolase activator NlpD [Rhodoglobus vestalii]
MCTRLLFTFAAVTPAPNQGTLLKRSITMLTVGAILIGGTVPAAVVADPENRTVAVAAANTEANGRTADSATADNGSDDGVQTFASPATSAAAPIVRDTFAVERVRQEVIITASGPTGSLDVFPANGPINDGWGYRGSEFHSGVDIMAPEGSAIVAASAGTVESVTTGGGWGRHVIVDHGGGVKTLYAHMIEGSQAVSAGQWVAAGQALGAVGNTGRSTFPHLHFEVYVFDTRIDPMPWLP